MKIQELQKQVAMDKEEDQKLQVSILFQRLWRIFCNSVCNEITKSDKYIL